MEGIASGNSAVCLPSALWALVPNAASQVHADTYGRTVSCVKAFRQLAPNGCSADWFPPNYMLLHPAEFGTT
jgi:hypothetical protein